MAKKLDADLVQEKIAGLDGWALDDGKLFRAFEFRNFIEAIGFMMRASIEAEKMGHHPEWFNVYAKVNVHLTTHSADGITELDFMLARIMDELAH